MKNETQALIGLFFVINDGLVQYIITTNEMHMLYDWVTRFEVFHRRSIKINPPADSGKYLKLYSPEYDRKRVFLPTLMTKLNVFCEIETEGDTLWKEITGSMKI